MATPHERCDQFWPDWTPDIECGFLIVKRFEALFLHASRRLRLRRDFYAFPRMDQEPHQARIRYRGLDRDALVENDMSDELVELRMGELFDAGRCRDGFLFTEEDVQDVWGWFGAPQDYEVIWTRIVGTPHPPPPGYHSIGFEPSFFIDDHFSASCDCMMFPRWHGADENGTLFCEHFARLNAAGLFNTAEEAEAFLRFYVSFDWTETGEWLIAEVFVKE